jgi:pyridoxal phosphate enzyme (YggS family)
MADIEQQLHEIRDRISAACSRSRHDPAEVNLIAVSKTFPEADIRTAVELGQVLFGESRLQEAAPKVEALPQHLEWHFIGRVQKNKVRKILPLFETVHAVDSMKLAAYMDDVAKDLDLRPNIFLQVNQAGEESKGGFSPDSLLEALPEISELKHIEVVGLMSIPPAVENPEDSRHWFAGLRELSSEIRQKSGLKLPYLSMGMSGDFEVAVEEGATHVRVGSSIFGKR